METAYAHALWNLVKKGMKPAEALSSIVDMLKQKGRMALLPKIARAFERIANRESNRTSTTLFVAHEKDAKKAMLESKVPEADVLVDSTLIGGWRLIQGDTLIDASWKKHLLSMYNAVAK